MNTNQTELSEAVLAWCLGSFHTAVTMMVFVTVLYRAGSLSDGLGALGTFIGLAVYAGFWLSTGIHSAKALQRIGLRRIANERPAIWGGELFGSFTTGGAFNGTTIWLLISVPLLFVLTAGAVTANGVERIPGIIVAGTFLWSFGAFIAAIVGGFIGMMFAIIDELVLLVALRLSDTRPQTSSA